MLDELMLAARLFNSIVVMLLAAAMLFGWVSWTERVPWRRSRRKRPGLPQGAVEKAARDDWNMALQTASKLWPAWCLVCQGRCIHAAETSQPSSPPTPGSRERPQP
jgi:hypothetical protein